MYALDVQVDDDLIDIAYEMAGGKHGCNVSVGDSGITHETS
jgi:hypothetical protein